MIIPDGKKVTIKVTRQDFPCIDYPTFDFEWIGPEDGVVPMSQELYDADPQILNKMPWTLSLIGVDPPIKWGEQYNRGGTRYYRRTKYCEAK